MPEHNLGSGSNQASPGNHTHDGGASATIDELEDAIVSITGILASLTNMVTLDSAQTITGVKTFGAEVTADKLVQRGSGVLTCTTPNVPVSTVITFPVAFPGTPTVIAGLVTGISGTVTSFVWCNSPSSTSFTLNMNRSSTTVSTINWIATY